MDEIEAFYNKYNEDKRLKRPYGRVEYLTTLHYIRKYIGDRKSAKILDIGCGTGVYAVPLAEDGHAVDAVDLVNYHVGILKQKKERLGLESLTVRRADALDLRKLPEEAYDIVLCLGPLYHMFSEEDKVKVLLQAKKRMKPDGILFAGYIMNEFGVLIYGFREKNALASLESGKLDPDFHIRNTKEDLFSFERMEDISRYNEAAGLERIRIIASDGPANYMREKITEMDEKQFDVFYRYHLSTCEKPELIGASNHTLDILRIKRED